MIPDSIKCLLPYFAAGPVVKGFGRGSKQLGCPTANFADYVTTHMPPGFQCGVYCGWAQVEQGPVHKMVMSVGYNPYFHNTKKTMETHIIHNFDRDFYGSWLKVAITGYIRDMQTFKSIDELRSAIDQDVEYAKTALNSPDQVKISHHPFFLSSGEDEAYIGNGCVQAQRENDEPHCFSKS